MYSTVMGPDTVKASWDPITTKSGFQVRYQLFDSKYDYTLLLCSHSPNDVPPEPQGNVSIAAVRGAMRLSKSMIILKLLLLKYA